MVAVSLGRAAPSGEHHAAKPSYERACSRAWARCSTASSGSG